MDAFFLPNPVFIDLSSIHPSFFLGVLFGFIFSLGEFKQLHLTDASK